MTTDAQEEEEEGGCMKANETEKAGRVLRLDRITHDRLSRLDRAHTLVMAVVSPIEVHGPHLPLGQDLMQAYALSERVLENVAAGREAWSFVLLPPIPVATDCVPQIGSLNFPVSLVQEVAYHLLKPFALHGFARLAFTSFHGGPRHNCALEAAAERLAREHRETAVLPVFSAVIRQAMEGRIFFDGIEHTPGRKITLEQIKQDHHAGCLETSMGLYLWPELLEPGWQDLPAEVSNTAPDGKHEQHFLYGGEDPSGILGRAQRIAGRVRAMARSARHFRTRTYQGYPALASQEQGRDTFDHLVRVAEGVIEEFLDRGREMDGHSPMWDFRRVLLSPAVNRVFDDWLGVYTEKKPACM
jgi:creatinine amidohydrolase